MANGGPRRAVGAVRSLAVRLGPGLAVAVGGGVLSTFTALGWWVAGLGVALIVAGLAWGMRQDERLRSEAARPTLPGDPGRLPRRPPHVVGADHLHLVEELAGCLVRPGAYLVTGPVGSGKTTVCAEVLNTQRSRRLFLHNTDGQRSEDRRFWADLHGRRGAAEVDDAIAAAMGAASLAEALVVLGDDAPTLLVLDDVDEAFEDADHPALRRLLGLGGHLCLVVSARGNPPLGAGRWSRMLTTTTLSGASARALFGLLAPERVDDPVVEELLERCDGLALAVRMVASLAATVNDPGELVGLADRALRGAGGLPEARRLHFALALADAALDEEEREAWGALARFPGGLGRDDLRSVLGDALAEHDVARLLGLGLGAHAGAGLRVPRPLHPPRVGGDDDARQLWERFVRRGNDVLGHLAGAGERVNRHSLNLAALARLPVLPAGSLSLATRGLLVERSRRRLDLAETALVGLASASMVEPSDAEEVTTAAKALVGIYRMAAAAQLLGSIVAHHRRMGDPSAAASALVTAGDVARLRDRYDDAEGHYQEAQATFDEIGDRHGGATARRGHGDVALLRGRYDDAEGHYQQAQATFDEIGDRHGGATSCFGRGDVALLRGRYDDAEGHYQQAQATFDEIGDRQGGANARRGRGDVARARDRYDHAEGHYREAQTTYNEIGDRQGGANARRGRGEVARARGRYDDSEGHFSEAQATYDEIGERQGGANARLGRGDVARARGCDDDAEGHYRGAQTTYDEIGDRLGGANARLGRGEVALARGRDDDAESHFREAQATSDEIGDRLGGATARLGRGDVARLRGRDDAAEGHYREAQATYDEFGDRRGGANARLRRGEVALAMAKVDSPTHLASARERYLEAASIYGEIGDLAWRGRALVGAARSSVDETRLQLATQAAAYLEEAGKLTEARALEEEFGPTVSIGAAIRRRPDLQPPPEEIP